jgi:hypothetical protein
VLLEITAAGTAIVAVIALARAVSTGRRLATLSQASWELRYEFARLRARVAKLDGGQDGADPDDPAADVRPETGPR